MSKEKNQVTQPVASQPQVQQKPVWSSKEELMITGLEFELIYNALTSLANAMGAASAVLNRGVLSGKVGFVFEKPDETGNMVELSEEESKPYREQLATLIENAKAEIAEKPQPEPTEKPQMQVVK